MSFDAYFLTKSGRRIDSLDLYVSDQGADFEHEGFIRYRHYDLWKRPQFTGLLNRNGDIAIKANRFNYLSRVHNGMLWAEEGAICKTMADGRIAWEGGSGTILIDAVGRVLINAGKCLVDQNNMIYLKLHFCQITPAPHTDTTRVSFKGVNGEYYSFVDYRKEFVEWIKERAKDIDETNVDSILGPEIALAIHNGEVPLTCQPGNLDLKYKKLVMQVIIAIAKGDAMHGIYQKHQTFPQCDGWLGEYSIFGKRRQELPEFVVKAVDSSTYGSAEYSFCDTDQGYKLSKIDLIHLQGQ
ncbi:MAG: hypothetical protein LUE99_04675 [Bacteroides sp.]|nr:hypothetical protein [Bacteroides sp.]